jgi:nucleotide-binding universal stress UspA family protein
MLPLTSIVVPTDFSEQSEIAIAYAKEWAVQFSATIHLVHIIEPVVFPMDLRYSPIDLSTVEKHYVEAAHQQLIQKVESIRKEGISIIPAIVHGGRASEEINNYCIQHAISMICMATHGRGGMEYLLLGSTTERLIRKSTCPIMVIKVP